MPPQLSLATLYDMKDSKDKKKFIIFDEIITKCHKKITHTAKIGGYCIFFEIPYFIIGKPLYDISQCTQYVINSLKKNGLFVSLLAPPNNNIIYISWNPSDINKRKKIK